MTEILAFMGEHPFLAFVAILSLAQIILAPFNIISRIIRHFNIRKHGWPPAHLDADGDFNTKE